MVRVLLAAALLLAGCSASGGEDEPVAATSGTTTVSPKSAGFDQALHDELMEMLERDQSGRTGGPDAEGDAARTARMKEILEQHGWPTFDLVGEDGEDAAWAIVQHSDQDPAFQRKALELLRTAVAAGQESPAQRCKRNLDRSLRGGSMRACAARQIGRASCRERV